MLSVMLVKLLHNSNSIEMVRVNSDMIISVVRCKPKSLPKPPKPHKHIETCLSLKFSRSSVIFRKRFVL